MRSTSVTAVTLHELDAVPVRFSTVYSPCQRPNIAFRKRTAATLEDCEMAIHGDGTSTRDLTHLSYRVEEVVMARTAQVRIVTSPGIRNRVSLNEADETPGEIARAEPRIFYQPVEAADAIPLRLLVASGV